MGEGVRVFHDAGLPECGKEKTHAHVYMNNARQALGFNVLENQRGRFCTRQGSLGLEHKPSG